MFLMTLYHTAPSELPQSLSNISVSISSVTIQWSRVECLKRNSEITGYAVRYRRPNSTAMEVNISGVMESDRMFTITRLNPHTSYMIEVMAMNRENQLGPSANIVVVTSIPEGEYVQLTCFVTQKSISIVIPMQVLVFSSMVYSMVTTAL